MDSPAAIDSVPPKPDSSTPSVSETQAPKGELRWSGQRRFKYFVTGVIGPIGCFGLVWSGMNARLDPLWQSGEVKTYATLLLEKRELLPFMPLLTCSMISMSLVCLHPRLSDWLLVRVGIYSGAILSTQYLLCVVFATSFFTFVLAAIVGPALAFTTYLAAKLMPQARRTTIWQLMLLTTVVAAITAAVAASGINQSSRGSVLNTALAWGFWTLVAVPLLNCLTYVRASFGLLHSRAHLKLSGTDKLKFVALCSGWFVGFAASWKLSLNAMLADYAALPTVEPSCYVSAAAANGHRRFVGVAQFAAAKAACDLHPAFPVNLQMCRLKFLEFALAAASPRLHAVVRRAYNALGPGAASVCRSNVWLADAGYVGLKPLEWLAELLRRFAKVALPRVAELYCLSQLRGRAENDSRT